MCVQADQKSVEILHFQYFSTLTRSVPIPTAQPSLYTSPRARVLMLCMLCATGIVVLMKTLSRRVRRCVAASGDAERAPRYGCGRDRAGGRIYNPTEPPRADVPIMYVCVCCRFYDKQRRPPPLHCRRRRFADLPPPRHRQLAANASP